MNIKLTTNPKLNNSFNDIKRALRKDKIILYHGSREGLKGDIAPISRKKCDFGKGFYMGSSPEQVKGLVVESKAPHFYTLEIDLTKIDPNKILILDEDLWLYTVLANRCKTPGFNESKFCKDLLRRQEEYDFIVGPIADDRMNEALGAFNEFSLTDIGLKMCLSRIDYGFQFVAKTQKACEKIKVVSSRPIYGKEADDIRIYTQEKRLESKGVVENMRRLYRREGLYIDELIDKISNLQMEDILHD